MLVAQSLSFSYSATANIFTDISIEIEPGDRLAIVGPSGSGKSTLLKVLGAVLQYDHGTLHYHDSLVNSEFAPKYLRDIGWITQNPGIFPSRTALENVTLLLELLGVAPKLAQMQGLEALTAVGLREKAHQKVGLFSGGETYRVSIARTVAKKPPIIFADEITAMLDFETSLSVLEALAPDVTDESALVMATHDPTAAKFADKVLELRNGKLAEISGIKR